MPPNIDYGWPNTYVDADAIVLTGPGTLHSIVLNGVTVVGDIAVYDGTDATGRLIARLNVRTAVSVSFQGVTFMYDARVVDGIFIDIASSTFAGNITVMHS